MLGANNGRRYVFAHIFTFSNETQTMAYSKTGQLGCCRRGLPSSGPIANHSQCSVPDLTKLGPALQPLFEPGRRLISLWTCEHDQVGIGRFLQRLVCGQWESQNIHAPGFDVPLRIEFSAMGGVLYRSEGCRRRREIVVDNQRIHVTMASLLVCGGTSEQVIPESGFRQLHD